MTQTTWIDIVLPNYNKAGFISECLDSLVSQTFKNWRCFVIDGFSDDGSWEIIKSYSKNDSRFELYQIPRQGIYHSWNFGLEKVDAPFFCILTSDDIWSSNWLETGIKTLTLIESAVSVSARTRIIDKYGIKKKIAPHNIFGESFYETNLSQIEIRKGFVDSLVNYFLGSIYTSIHSLLIRRTILEQGENFSEDVGAIADCEWYLRMGLYGNIVYVPNTEVYWRVYKGQSTNPKQQKKNGEYMIKIHSRNQKDIVKKLDKNSADLFLKMAPYFDSKILSYRYTRPCIDNLYSNFFDEVPNLISSIKKFPFQFLKDCVYYTEKKNYFLEEGTITLNQILGNQTYIL